MRFFNCRKHHLRVIIAYGATGRFGKNAVVGAGIFYEGVVKDSLYLLNNTLIVFMQYPRDILF